MMQWPPRGFGHTTTSERPLRSVDDVDVTRAIEYLEYIDESYHEGKNSLLHEGDRLVVDEDRLLLTV
jgi:hypothetical protein